MRGPAIGIALLLLLASPAQPQPLQCDGSTAAVIAERPDDAALACKALTRAHALFGACNIPPITRPLNIDVTDDIDTGCFGLYHCGDNRIELLTPAAMATKRGPDSIFADLPLDRFFQSIVVHELTHAALDDAPCPFAGCLVGHEYVAYVMQIMSLTPEQRRRLEERADLVGRRISRDELSSTMYFMAPERFAVKAWMHFTQRADPCGFLGQIVEGTVVLQRERFE